MAEVNLERASSPSRSARSRPRTGQRASEHARERLLAAALDEFGAKGYAGARTRDIAARAGLNQQLISYYFGGKRGLLEELRRRWEATESSLVPADATFAESVSAYMAATLDRPDWARLVIWRALGDDPGDDDARQSARRAKLRAAVERTRGRQRDGELPGDVEAEFVLLVAYALAFAPIAMPQLVEAIMGVEACSSEYRRRCVEALLRLLDPDREAHPSAEGAS